MDGWIDQWIAFAPLNLTEVEVKVLVFVESFTSQSVGGTIEEEVMQTPKANDGNPKL